MKSSLEKTRVVIIMDAKKVENKNKLSLIVISVFILLAILIAALGYKVNNKMEFYGQLINVAGRQRSTTFRILSDTESALTFYQQGDYNRYESLRYTLFEDGEKIDNYFKVMMTLKEYSEDYSLSKAKSEEINDQIDNIVDDMYSYITYVEAVLDNPQNAYESGAFDLMLVSSETCFEELDKLVLELQENYNLFTNIQRYLIVTCVFVLGICALAISHLLKKIKVIEFIAKYDYLTGVKNISYLTDETKNYTDEGYAILFIDLNKFKLINDTYGHSIGDEILREMGKRLKKELTGNLVFRYGGDEFVVFIKNENTNRLEEYIEKINNNVFSIMIDSCRREHKVSGSVGVIGKDVTKYSVEEAVKIADSIMYKAKDEDIVLYARTDEDVQEMLASEQN